MLGTTLLNELLSWSLRAEKLEVSHPDYVDWPFEQVRSVGASLMRRGMPIQDLSLGREFADALEGLNAGHEARLLQRRKGRRGADPHEVARAEFELLKLIRWKHGCGVRVGRAEAEVADAVGLTIAAVRKWPAELEKVFTRDRVHSELRLAEEVGRYEAMGGMKAIADDGTITVEKKYHLLRIGIVLERDLGKLVRQRRAALKGDF